MIKALLLTLLASTSAKMRVRKEEEFERGPLLGWTSEKNAQPEDTMTVHVMMRHEDKNVEGLSEGNYWESILSRKIEIAFFEACPKNE